MSETKRTALETWTMEVVNAVLPEGTSEQQQRLACAIMQGRAKECRSLSAMFKMSNPTNPIVDEVCRHMIERETKLEQIALKWAEPAGWPPPEGVTAEAAKEKLVQLQ